MFAPLRSQMESFPLTASHLSLSLYKSFYLYRSNTSSPPGLRPGPNSRDFWHFSSPLTQSFGTLESPRWAWGDSRRNTAALTRSTKPGLQRQPVSLEKTKQWEWVTSVSVEVFFFFKQRFQHQSALAWGFVALFRCWGPPRTPTAGPWSWGSGRWWASWFWQTCRRLSWSSRCASSGRRSRWWLNETRLPGSGSEGPYLLDVLPLQREGNIEAISHPLKTSFVTRRLVIEPWNELLTFKVLRPGAGAYI